MCACAPWREAKVVVRGGMLPLERVQQLHDVTAAAAAESAEPSDDRIREICRIMEQITPADLRLATVAPLETKQAEGPRIIRTQGVYECEAFDIVVFLFPAGSAIPPHDHPGMTVLSKVLYGSLGMCSYDWLQPPTRDELDEWSREQDRIDSGKDAQHPERIAGPRAARRRGDTVLTPEAPTFVLRPHFCNIHAFEATADCAVLDVLLPPYDDDRGRDCHYFAEAPSSEEPADAAMLALIGAPPELVIRRATYHGPVVTSSTGAP